MLPRWRRSTSALLGILAVLQSSSAFLMNSGDPYWSDEESENSPWSLTRVRRRDDDFLSNEPLQMDSMYPSHLPLIVAALDAVKGRNRRYSGSSTSSQVARTYTHGHRKSFSSWRGKRSYNGITLDSPFSLLWRRKRRSVSLPLEMDKVRNRSSKEYRQPEEEHASEASIINVPLLLPKPGKQISESSDTVSYDKEHGLKHLKSKTVTENHSVHKRSIDLDIDDIVRPGDQGHLRGQTADKEAQQSAFQNLEKTPKPLAEKHLHASTDSEDLAIPRIIMKSASQFNGKIAPVSSKEETTQVSRGKETVGMRHSSAERTPKQMIGEDNQTALSDDDIVMTSNAGTASPWSSPGRRPIADVRDMTHGRDANRSTSSRNKNAVRHSQWHQLMSIDHHNAVKSSSSEDQAAHDDFHMHITDSSQPGVGPFFWVESVESVADPADRFHGRTQGMKDSRPTIPSAFGDRTDPTIFDINADRTLLATLTSRAIIDEESAPHHGNTVHDSRATQSRSGEKTNPIHNSQHLLPKMSEDLRLVPFHPAELSRHRPASSTKVAEKSDTNSSELPQHWLPVFRKQQAMSRRQRLPLTVTHPPGRVSGLQEPSPTKSAARHPTEHAVRISTQGTIRNTVQRPTKGLHAQRPAQGLPQNPRGNTLHPPPPSLPSKMNLNDYFNRTLTSELSPIKQMGLGALPFLGDSTQHGGAFPSLGGAGLMGTHADVEEDTPYGKRQIKYREFAVLSTQGGISLSANDRGYLTVKVAVMNDDTNGTNDTDIMGDRKAEYTERNNFSEDSSKSHGSEDRDGGSADGPTTFREFYFQSHSDNNGNKQDGIEDSLAFGPTHTFGSRLQPGQEGRVEVGKYITGDPDNKEETISSRPTRMTTGEGFLSDTILKRRQHVPAAVVKHYRQDLHFSSAGNYHGQRRSPLSEKQGIKSHMRMKRSLQSPRVSHELALDRAQIRNSLKESNTNSSGPNPLSVDIHDSQKSSNNDSQQKSIPSKNGETDIHVKQSIRSYKTFQTRVPKPLAQLKAKYPRPVPHSWQRRYSNKAFPRSLLFKPIHSALSNPYLKFRNNKNAPRQNFRAEPPARSSQSAFGGQGHSPAIDSSPQPHWPAVEENTADDSATGEHKNDTGTPLSSSSTNDTDATSDRIKDLLKLFNIKFNIFFQPFTGNRGRKNHTDMDRERRDRWWDKDQGYTSYFPFPLGNMGWVNFLQYNHVNREARPEVSYAMLKRKFPMS